MQKPPKWVIDMAVKVAKTAWCAKDSRGVVAFASNYRAVGFVAFTAAANGPPPPFKCGGQTECRAACGKLAGHAEERALWAWWRNWAGVGDVKWIAPGTPPAPDLVHIRVVDGQAVPSGGPSCITCSRTILMAGAAAIWLWHEEGWRRYEPAEFHTLSLLHEKHNLPVIR